MFNREETDLPHPNTMLFTALKEGQVLESVRVFSIGGGSIRFENEEDAEEREIYPQQNLTEILEVCRRSDLSLRDFIFSHEDANFREYLRTVWHAMRAAVERGLRTEGILPGGLNVSRKAKLLYDFLDASKMFKGTVVPEYRSLMNVPFVTDSDDLNKKFIEEATKAGFVNLKGHRTVGGMRASIYNAMPTEGVKKLVEFMDGFEKENK